MLFDISKCKELLKHAHLGNLQKVIELLACNDVDVNYVARFTRGNILDKNAITYASINGHHEIVERLLEKGASTECDNAYRKSPLFHAIENKHTQTALALIRFGSLEMHELYRSPHLKIPLGILAMKHALNNKMFDVVNGLLQAGAYTMPINNAGIRSCYEEVTTDLFSYGDVSIVNELLLNHRSSWEGDQRASFAVCKFSKPEVVKLFVDKEGGVDSHIAAFSHNLGYVDRENLDDTLRVRKIFLEKFCHLNVYDIFWIYPEPEIDTIGFFLQQGNDINLRGQLGITPLMIAAQIGEPALVGRMIDAGADITAINAFGGTALTMAVRVDNVQVVEQLVMECTHALLLDAVVHNDVETVRDFVNLRRIDINHADKNGKNALMHACEDKNLEMADVILGKMQWNFDLFHKYENVAPLEICADINAKDKDGDTALAHSCRNGNNGVVNFLLNSRADVNSRNNDGDSALALSCKNANHDAVKMLLLNKADINSHNSEGNTALMISCVNNDAGFVDLLLSSVRKSVIESANHGGVNYEYIESLTVDVKSNADQTALTLIYVGDQNTDVVNPLIDAGSKDKRPFDMHGWKTYGDGSLFDLEDDGGLDDFAAGVKKQRITFLRKDHEDEMQGIDDQQEVQLLPRADFSPAYAEDAPDIALNAEDACLSFASPSADPLL